LVEKRVKRSVKRGGERKGKELKNENSETFYYQGQSFDWVREKNRDYGVQLGERELGE